MFRLIAPPVGFGCRLALFAGRALGPDVQLHSSWYLLSRTALASLATKEQAGPAGVVNVLFIPGRSRCLADVTKS